jgi:chemotaxis protein MotB
MAEFDEVEDEVEAGAPLWMATYSDLATLLLTFFVLMLSFANMDVVNFQVALGSIRKAMGVQYEVKGRFEAQNTTPIEFAPRQSHNKIEMMDVVRKAEKQVTRAVKKAGKSKAVDVKGTPRGLVVRMRDAVLFDRGRAELKPGGREALKIIEEIFAAFGGQMTIEGHTDDVPIYSTEFKSNWELSAARSIAVLRYFTGELEIGQERMQIAGYADTRPLVPNTSESGRTRNRRVEFLFQYPHMTSDGKGGAKRAKMFDFSAKSVREEIRGIRRRAPIGDPVAFKKDGGAVRESDAGDRREANQPGRENPR